MPLVSKTFDQLLDFTRTSAATFVGSNGLIQTTPASVNLLTWTQQFDNAVWTKNAITVTANTTVAPDGTSTADTVTESATNDLHAAFQTSTLTALTTHTISAYVRAGTRSFAMLRVGGGGFTTGPAIKASLTGAGSTTTIEGPVVSSAITSVGGGWYRVSMTFVSTATTAGYAPQIGPHNNGSAVTYLGDGSGIFIWGAQLEAASAASTYTRNNGGVFPPRFDYDPVTLAAKGLLIEEQRTNLQTYSEDFTNAIWTSATLTIAANSTASPDGTVNADTGTRTTTGVTENMRRATTAQAISTTYTVTVYVKANTAGARLYMRNLAVDNTATTGVVQFNPADGTVSTTYGSTYVGKATMTAAGNGWYRCSITGTTGGTIANNFIDIGVTDGTSAVGGNAANSVFIWGAQLEAGAFATSYIPTVASQVTRTADSCAIVAPNFSPWYNQSEGTFVVEADGPAIGTQILTQADDNTANNRITARFSAATSAMVVVTAASGVVALSQGLVVANTPAKVAIAYKQNDCALSFNGTAPALDTLATMPTVSRLGIGTNASNLEALNGHIRSIRYYPTRLTNAQLQALTA